MCEKKEIFLKHFSKILKTHLKLKKRQRKVGEGGGAKETKKS
jgi:hypothetical protein